MNKSWAFNGLIGAAALLLPLTGATDSDVRVAASGALSATAQLNFKVIIPQVLFLQVSREGTVIQSNGARKTIAPQAHCIPDGPAGGRLICTASVP